MNCFVRLRNFFWLSAQVGTLQRQSMSYLCLLAIASAPHAAQLERFSPAGDVGHVAQASARFDEAVVPLGVPDAPAPYTWTCSGASQGHGHWADQLTWVVDFAPNLQSGVKCTFTPSAAFRALDGKTPKLTAVSFNTGIELRISPAGNEWEELDSAAAFLISSTTPLDLPSVASHAWCALEGVGERVPMEAISGKDRTEILSALDKTAEAKQIATLRCKRALPEGTRMSVVIDPGVKSTAGLVTSQPVRAEYFVKMPFGVTVHCERENARADCTPVAPITLNFTASVNADDVKRIMLIGPDGRKWEAKPNDSEYEYSDHTSLQFAGPFPPKATLSLKLPAQIRDEEGRPLNNIERLARVTLKTDDYPPLLKFAADFGIIERKGGGMLPATLRNLDPLGESSLPTADGSRPGTSAKVRILRLTRDEEIMEWMYRQPQFLTPAIDDKVRDEREGSLLVKESRARTLLLPKPNGDRPMEVVGIPLNDPGYYVVEAESRLLGQHLIASQAPMFVQTRALNTNLSVHLKLSAENQLVWVTTLDSAAPVAGAQIAIRNCAGTLLESGVTGKDGTLLIPRSLPKQPKCEHRYDGYFVSARSKVDGVEDISFVMSSWQQGIETWRFELPWRGMLPDVITHTVFDRPLFRVGETVHMRHYARRHSIRGLEDASAASLPNRVAIQFEGDDQSFEFPLTWKNGSADTEWTIPPGAKLGRYWVAFLSSNNRSHRMYTGEDMNFAWQGQFLAGGSFRVGEFRLPVLKGELTAAAPVIAGPDANVDLRLSYIAGGAASGEKVRVRSEIRPYFIQAAGFEAFAFGSQPLTSPQIQKGEWNPSFEDTKVFDDQRDLALDKSGSRRVIIRKIPQRPVPAQVYSEMEFSDPSGEIHAAGGTTLWFPASVVAGVSADAWAQVSGPVRVKLASLDTSLKPVAADYSVHAWQRRYIVHRKRLVGGFYSYDQQVVVADMGEVCKGRTGSNGQAECSFAAPKDIEDQQSGEIIVEMRARDPQSRVSYANTSIWVSGNAVWFEQGDSDRIEVVPEKKAYEPGDTAVFQVRSPFRDATALVSVEREGVIDHFVTRISSDNPTIKVPVKAVYGPNVYVSALLVRGRVGDVQPTAMVDLGKPAYRLGIGSIDVGHSAYTLQVNVKPERNVYKTREQVSARIQVRRPDGQPASHGEFVLAAVDEALLELARNDSWQILPRMMLRRGYGVETATAQALVIGKRHFGLKALPAGGGGGKQATRELFDTLIKWNARVTLDQNGEATVNFPLNDALTSIRIVAVATEGPALFGTGWARIRTTKDVQIFSGLPQVVRDADQFRAGFTVRNMSGGKDRLTLTATATLIASGKRTPVSGMTPQTIELDAGAGRELAWNITVPAGVNAIEWVVSAAGTRGDQDALKTIQTVMPSYKVQTYGATLEQVKGNVTVPVKLTADAVPGRGSVEVFLKSRLGVSSDTVREYMENYAYSCLEQRVSKSIATSSRARWDDTMKRLPTYLDRSGLVSYYPNPGKTNRPSVALTAYLLSIAHESGYVIPDAERMQMLAGLAGYIEGTVTENPEVHWPRGNDLPMRRLAALEALARHGEATPARLATVAVDPAHWPMHALIDWLGIIKYSPAMPGRDKRWAEAENILRARLITSGTTTQFANEAADYWWWVMSSPDANAARAINLMMDRPAWARDMPKLVRGVVARQHEGHWSTTPANVWGGLMLNKFARTFEKEPVRGTTQIILSGSATPAQTQDWGTASVDTKSVNDPGKSFSFAWPAGGAGNVTLAHQGSGAPWATIRTRSARLLAKPLFAGFTGKKTLTVVEQKRPGQWTRGDLVRVDIEVSAPGSWTSVVVNDPVPAGAVILGGGLGGESQITQEKAKGVASWASYEERAFDAYRAYFGYFGSQAHVSYVMRLNNAGDFKLPPTRIEAMYAPENFAELPNGDWHVVQ
ncbi:alpha-2-macroglobulin [Burkholderiaceae bacterium DAT-1]|nr:alpha-2-macroglobulin [Burkholderiaceae bacterium DAT-1]